jgi:putative membrane protein
MTQQFSRIALFAAAIGLVNTGAFAQQGGGAATRGSSPGQTTQGTTETRPTTQTERPATQTESKQNAGASGQLASADQAFVKEAATGGLMEVELGRLAAEKASNAEVKQFAQRMVDDHGKANQQLSTIAQQKNVQVPTELTGKAKADHDRLSKLSGEQFDRAYMQLMVQDHRKDVGEFRKQSTKAKDADVKSFASQTLPTLEDHLKMAQQTQSALNGARATSGKPSGSASTPQGTGGTQPKGTPTTPPSQQK